MVVVADAMMAIGRSVWSYTHHQRLKSLNAVSFAPIGPVQRIVFGVGCILMPSVTMMSQSLPNLALIYCCASRAQFCIAVGLMFTMFHSVNPEFWTYHITIIFIVMFGIGFVLGAFGSATSSSSLLLDYTIIVYGTGFCFVTLFIFQIVRNLIYFGKATVLQIAEERRALYMSRYNYTVFLIAMMGVVLPVALFGTSYPSFDDSALLYGNALFILMQWFIILDTAQFIKIESEERMMQYHDLKTSHLRYIAHELR